MAKSTNNVARVEGDEIDPCAPVSPSTTAQTTTTGPSGTRGDSAGRGPLARTGADTAGILGLGLALLAAGCAVVFTVRRSQREA